jgi:hypothetical protein
VLVEDRGDKRSGGLKRKKKGKKSLLPSINSNSNEAVRCAIETIGMCEGEKEIKREREKKRPDRKNNNQQQTV